MNKTFRKIGAGAAAVTAAGLAWGLIEPYTIDVRRYQVTLPHLPDRWRGARIGVLGDIQLGMWLANVRTVRRAVQSIIRERPAAALLLGDFIYLVDDPEREEIGRSVELVRPIVEAGIPTYTVLGNHDYHMELKVGEPDLAVAAALRERLETAGVRVLDNDVVKMGEPAGSPPLYLAGIGSHYANQDWGEETVSRIPQDAARIVLMHHPDSFAALSPHSAPLAIAGHTHGGQFRPPFNRQWSLMNLIQKDKVYTEGWIDGVGAPGNNLYVNRGLGFSILPLRINAPPEVTFFTLA